MTRRSAAKLTFAAVLSATGCGGGDRTRPGESPPPPGANPIPVELVGFPAVDRATADLNKALADLKGKVVVVDAWATWCLPCVKGFPNVVALQKRYADKGVVCVGINLDVGNGEPLDRAKVQEFLAEKDARFPNFALSNRADSDALQARLGLEGGIPYVAVFDRDGKRVWDSERDVTASERKYDELDAAVAKLLK